MCKIIVDCEKCGKEMKVVSRDDGRIKYDCLSCEQEKENLQKKIKSNIKKNISTIKKKSSS